MIPIHKAPKVELPEDSPSSAEQFEGSLKMPPPNSLGFSNVFEKVNEKFSENPSIQQNQSFEAYFNRAESLCGNKEKEGNEKSENQRIELIRKKLNTLGSQKNDPTMEGN